MPSSGMLHYVAVVRTDVSEKHIATTIHDIVFLRSVLRLLVTANVVPTLPSLVILMMEVIHSSKTAVLTRAILHNIPEDGIFRSHRCENLKSYITGSD
jgi:hypothetical protein